MVPEMARRRTYDDHRVRQGLVATFLATGYADTSLADLESGTGLDRRQLYNGFGDKKTMFLGALDDFTEAAADRFLAPLETGSDGLADVEAALWGLLADADDPEARLGCLVCNTSREAIATDPDIGPVIDRFFRRIEGGYRAALTRAVARNELGPDDDPARLARLLLAIHVSLCVLARAGESAEVLHDIAAATLERIR